MVLVVFSLLLLPFRMLWRAVRRKKRLRPWIILAGGSLPAWIR
jgi:hypothetical protein